MEYPMKLELTLAGLLINLANHYTTQDAHNQSVSNWQSEQWKSDFTLSRDPLQETQFIVMPRTPFFVFLWGTPSPLA